MPITINQAAVLALSISREVPRALDHHIANAVETVSALFDTAMAEAGVEYDFDTAVDRGCDFAEDEVARDAEPEEQPASYLDLVAA